MYEDDLTSIKLIEDGSKDEIIKKYLDKFKLKGEKCDNCKKIKNLKEAWLFNKKRNYCEECYIEYEKLINNSLF
jgi:hypothetical protein